MSLRCRHSRSAGFTLLEVLAALVLVGLVLPAVMKGISLAMSASDDARKRIEAMGLGETKLSELAASTTSSTQAGSSGDFAPEFPGYRWEASAASVEADLTEIRVRVTWTARGSDRSVELATFAYTGTVPTSSDAPAGGTQ